MADLAPSPSLRQKIRHLLANKVVLNTVNIGASLHHGRPERQGYPFR